MWAGCALRTFSLTAILLVAGSPARLGLLSSSILSLYKLFRWQRYLYSIQCPATWLLVITRNFYCRKGTIFL